MHFEDFAYEVLLVVRSTRFPEGFIYVLNLFQLFTHVEVLHM